jgi:hypothetical protein
MGKIRMQTAVAACLPASLHCIRNNLSSRAETLAAAALVQKRYRIAKSKVAYAAFLSKASQARKMGLSKELMRALLRAVLFSHIMNFLPYA